MAVPKGKVSKQRRNTRAAANVNIVVPSLQECPQCHEQKQTHRVCKNCGYYDKEQVVVKKEKKAQEE
ncbi:MAG: 50S ribosomal protein L32 [Clostridia bacterium]|nr:50S ribosomal protein L32 [Clostridia bacterium]